MSATIKRPYHRKIQTQPLTPEALAQVEEVLEHHETYKNSYFWNRDNGNGQSRGRRERQLNFTVSIEHDGHCYQYVSEVSISRTNFYYKGRFTKDGNKSNVSLFKKLLAGK